MPLSDILTFLIAAFLICQTYKELSGTRAKSKEKFVCSAVKKSLDDF
jgi:hypothetical protein